MFSSQMLVLGKHCMIDRKQRMTEAILSILIWNRGLIDVSETVSGMSNISCLEANQQGAFHQLFKRQTEFFVIWYVAYKKNRIFAMNNGHWISVFALSTASPGLEISSHKNCSTGQENLIKEWSNPKKSATYFTAIKIMVYCFLLYFVVESDPFFVFMI